MNISYVFFGLFALLFIPSVYGPRNFQALEKFSKFLLPMLLIFFSGLYAVNSFLDTSILLESPSIIALLILDLLVFLKLSPQNQTKKLELNSYLTGFFSLAFLIFTLEASTRSNFPLFIGGAFFIELLMKWKGRQTGEELKESLFYLFPILSVSGVYLTRGNNFSPFVWLFLWWLAARYFPFNVHRSVNEKGLFYPMAQRVLLIFILRYFPVETINPDIFIYTALIFGALGFLGIVFVKSSILAWNSLRSTCEGLLVLLALGFFSLEGDIVLKAIILLNFYLFLGIVGKFSQSGKSRLNAFLGPIALVLSAGLFWGGVSHLIVKGMQFSMVVGSYWPPLIILTTYWTLIVAFYLRKEVSSEGSDHSRKFDLTEYLLFPSVIMMGIILSG